MKHATRQTLDGLETLLTVIRSHSEFKEKKQGIYYRKSKAFLHFHEDAAGLFADLRIGNEFQRFAVNTSAERSHFIAALRKALAE